VPIARGTMHAWQLQQTLPGAVVHDIAFPSASVGYAAAELGQLWKTTDGGAAAADWTSLVVDPNGGWFGNQFSLLASGHARTSGITYCGSSNGGVSWTCGPSVDPVFDGPTFFFDYDHGWVGGGEISPNVDGWMHRTTDHGATWSDRTLESPWPIREILFVTPDVGWAAGGNIY
jgi:photosystem II stability/assembly factor-like uncharacterized protein